MSGKITLPNNEVAPASGMVFKIVVDTVGGDVYSQHFKGAESVGGWLYLTEDELIFISHNFNIQKHKIAIPLNQISALRFH